MIRRRGKGWVLLTKDGKRVLGRHRTKKAAERQERAIKAAETKRRQRKH